MLEEVFIIIELSVYFDFNKNMKTKQKQNGGAHIIIFCILNCLLLSYFPADFYQLYIKIHDFERSSILSTYQIRVPKHFKLIIYSVPAI